MLQRIGVAQALINEPKLIFLDEPMAALDPIGRKRMRDIILRLKSEGKTVVYSTHILSDVEAICDRVAILSQGKLLGVGQPNNLLGAGKQLVEMNIEGLDEEGKAKIKRLALESIIERGNRIIVNISEEIAQEAQNIVVQHRAKLISLMPRTESLEDIFVRKMEEGNRE
jgi:ABC-2 type transport system ATP-binding protein